MFRFIVNEVNSLIPRPITDINGIGVEIQRLNDLHQWGLSGSERVDIMLMITKERREHA